MGLLDILQGPPAARYEDEKLDPRAYELDSLIKGLNFTCPRNPDFEGKLAPEPDPEQRAINAITEDIGAYCANPLSPVERLGRSNALVEKGVSMAFLPLTLANPGVVGITAAIGAGAAALYKPSLMYGIAGAVAGPIIFAASGIATSLVFRPIHFAIRDRNDEKLLATMPKKEQDLREKVAAYVTDASRGDDRFSVLVRDLHAHIQEPVLIPHQRLTRRQRNVYENAKREYPNGIYTIV